jgi:hypothetical protein
VVDDALLCPCSVHVTKGNKAAINEAKQLRQQFFDLGCVPLDCDRSCPVLNVGVCLPSPNGPMCQEV